jgi:hypothetical protein
VFSPNCSTLSFPAHYDLFHDEDYEDYIRLCARSFKHADFG